MTLLAQDRALLDRFRAGERKALESVYRHYAPKLSSLVAGGLATGGGRVRARSPFEAGAVVQEAFSRAFTEKARLAYDGLSPFLQYLAATARNFLLNELRVREDPASDQALETALGSRGSSAPVSSPAVAPDVAAEEKELAGLVARFLSGRDERERRVYEARFDRRLTQEDAARDLGLTRIQVRRAEAKLRRDLFEFLRANGYLDHVQPAQSSLARAADGGGEP